MRMLFVVLMLSILFTTPVAASLVHTGQDRSIAISAVLPADGVDTSASAGDFSGFDETLFAEFVPSVPDAFDPTSTTIVSASQTSVLGLTFIDVAGSLGVTPQFTTDYAFELSAENIARMVFEVTETSQYTISGFFDFLYDGGGDKKTLGQFDVSLSGAGGMLFSTNITTDVVTFDCCRIQTFGTTGVLAPGSYSLDLTYDEGINSAGGFQDFGGGVLGSFGLRFGLPEPAATSLLGVVCVGALAARARAAARA